MPKYIGLMGDENSEFEFSIEAKDVFEADKRLQKIAKGYGWDYLECTIADWQEEADEQEKGSIYQGQEA